VPLLQVRDRNRPGSSRPCAAPMNGPIRAVLLVFLFLITAGPIASGSVRKLRPIRIGLSIDDHSLKDLVILINSVLESALEPDELIVHIVACGKDHMAATVLKNSIASSLTNCLPSLKHELVAFVLPAESGFAQQLTQLKKKSNHWNSQSGADMVRFFMPSLFPTADRLLYLDNDIIVSCCLEEIWDTPFEAHQIAGIALDDLNWATVTQFKRHYNASHPLVIKNMRRSQPEEVQQEKNGQEISTKEFSAALPRYPNDGVLLLDVKKYNKEGILDIMNEIALANSRGEYCVNLGTQQFTVLALYDRWKELTPRANLRHFPDMARGYLMWFYYNGFLHYAGQHKPRLLCQTTTAENAQGRVPYLRVMSYTAWALSNFQVARRCPSDTLAYLQDCVAHVKEAPTLPALMATLHRIVSVSPDPSLLYIHIGAVHGNLSRAAYEQSGYYNIPHILNENSTYTPTIGTGSSVSKAEDMVEAITRTLLHNSSWSLRAYDYKLSRVERSAELLKAGGFAPPAEGAAAPDSKKGKKGKKEPPARTVAVRLKHFCDSERSPYKPAGRDGGPSGVADTTSVGRSLTTAGSGGPRACESVLAEIKSEGRAHWDAQVIVVDVAPPSSFPQVPAGGGAAGPVLGGRGTAGHTAQEAATVSKHTSLGVLLNLDLVFMRPKVLLVRLAAGAGRKLREDAELAHRFLRQNGYLTAQHSGPECGDSRLTHVHGNSNRSSNSSSSAVVTVRFTCLWGLRVNEFEFFPNLLT
jgi:lipopolysaccharide biosynthesis glycosyltransferase